MTDQTTTLIHDAFTAHMTTRGASIEDAENLWDTWLTDHHFTPKHTLPTPPSGYTYADTNADKLDPEQAEQTRDAIGLAWDTLDSAFGLLEHLHEHQQEGPAATLLDDGRKDIQCAASHLKQALLLLDWNPDDED